MEQPSSVQISHSGNDSLIAGRDIINNVAWQADDFIEIAVEHYARPLFPEPQIMPQLGAILHQHHMILLQGHASFELRALAYQLAWSITRQSFHHHNATDDFKVHEWKHKGDPRTFPSYIQNKVTSASIFLLTNISPQDMFVEILDELLHLQYNGSPTLYFILTTSLPFANWRLPTRFQPFWTSLPEGNLFEPSELARTLLYRLLCNRDTLPPRFALHKFDQAQPTTWNLDLPIFAQTALSANKLAGMLETFNNILAFITAISNKSDVGINESRQFTVRTLLRQINQIVQQGKHDAKDFFRTWFHTKLAEREQVLVISAGLLSGLYRNQFFNVLEHFSQTAFRKHNLNFVAFDYDDLTTLTTVFEVVPTRVGEPLLQIADSDLRHCILQEAVERKYGLLKRMLIEFVTLARGSLNPSYQARDLYGSKARCEHMRDVIAETLSKLSLINDDIVLETLAEFTIADRFKLRHVAATAIADWRRYEKHDQCFHILRRWYKSKSLTILSLIKENLHAAGHDQSVNAQAHLHALIAITIGEAAQYDPPNELSSQLIDLFVWLGESNDPLVQTAFQRSTIPHIVVRHLRQMRKQLFNLTTERHFYKAIAQSLAGAYAIVPEEVLLLLDRWHETARRAYKTPATSPPAKREILLATIILACGMLQDTHQRIPVRDLQSRFECILAEEHHPFLRQHLLTAIMDQMSKNSAAFGQYLQPLIEHLFIDEGEQVISQLVNLYRSQYAKLPNADGCLLLGNVMLPYWRQITRKKTSIESILHRWLIDEHSSPYARQAAIRSLIQFVIEVDLPLLQLLQKQDEQHLYPVTEEFYELEPAAEIQPKYRLIRANWIIERFIPLFLARSNSLDRLIIGQSLPVLIAKHNSQPEAILCLLKSLEQEHNQKMSTLGHKLSLGLQWSGRENIIVLMSLVILLFLLIMVCISVQWLSG